MQTPDPMQQSVAEHTARILALEGSHLERSHELLKLAANYRAMVLSERIRQQCAGVVAGGLFAGMRLLDQASEGCLLPKLLGCYEAPLVPQFRRIIAEGVDLVLNIGCAEGYYAVGLARLMPETTILAFDIDARARDMCGELAALNGVADRIRIAGRFAPADFAAFAGRRVLVLCDIEGGEVDLLDPLAAPALAGFSLIVELHDTQAGRPASTLIPERFAASHEVLLLSNATRTISLPPPFAAIREIDQLIAAWEMRGSHTPWAVLTPR